MLLHVVSGKLFQNRKELKINLGIGDATYKAKVKDNEIIFIETDYKKNNTNSSSNSIVYEKVHTCQYDNYLRINP